MANERATPVFSRPSSFVFARFVTLPLPPLRYSFVSRTRISNIRLIFGWFIYPRFMRIRRRYNAIKFDNTNKRASIISIDDSIFHLTEAFEIVQTSSLLLLFFNRMSKRNFRREPEKGVDLSSRRIRGRAAASTRQPYDLAPHCNRSVLSKLLLLPWFFPRGHSGTFSFHG